MIAIREKRAIKPYKLRQKPIPGLSDEERRRYEEIPESIDFVFHPCFELAVTEAELFGQAARPVDVPQWVQFVEVPEDVHAAQKTRTSLGKDDEQMLFLRYNYARYRLAKLLEAQRRRRSGARAREMIAWHDRVMAVRSDLVTANMGLVLAMTKRTRIPGVDLPELISEGNMALLRSVEKFDVLRGFKFSTYACRAILKGFNRLASKTIRYRTRFPVEYEPEMEKSDYDVMRHEMAHAESVEDLQGILLDNRADLTGLEAEIVRERFAIDAGGKKRTLAEVGRKVGLTNERVRQVQNVALGKLRTAMMEG